jgi:phage baseplate assembly protein W
MSDISNIPGQVSVVTVPRRSIEPVLPFQVDATGDIAVTSDPVRQAIQHIIDLALTSPGERVMRSSYGAGIPRMVFENASLAQFQAVAQRLQAAVGMTNSGVSNLSATVMQSPGDIYLFRVSFTLDQSPIVHQALFDYSGNLVGSS